MDDCAHTNLTVLNQAKPKLRCRYCHLTIAADDLPDGFCPECYEASGYKKYDFDAVPTPDSKQTRYRCEDCGIIIENK